MSIRSTVGNMNHSFKDTISSTLSSVKTRLENIVGSTSTALSNIWEGGFTGMSEAGMTELKSSLTTYCQDIEDLISGFDQSGDITSALLQAYVSTMKQEIAEADQAYQNFLKSGTSISQDVTGSASEIRSNASEIRLD